VRVAKCNTAVRDACRRQQREFGDFQTPPELAEAICRELAGPAPLTVLEPNCGEGTILTAAVRRFPAARRVLGFDLNARYVARARQRLGEIWTAGPSELHVSNFFETNWRSVMAQCPEPILIVGNPPWVTNATLGRLASHNHPQKENRERLSGIEALTGKSNFDVSEWMIYELLEAAAGRQATLAMLCKTAVAHKVLVRAWNNGLPIERSEIRPIDAAKHFGARVDACLLVCQLGRRAAPQECLVFEGLSSVGSMKTLGLREGRLVADLSAYDGIRHLIGGSFRWRSGIKHDCAAIFEFRREGSILRNGLGEVVDLEPTYLFPLLKSSHLSGEAARNPSRELLVPQRRVGQETDSLVLCAPKTWSYLSRHAERLDRRASSVYRKQPRFAVFGVGPYTFCEWKVAVSGFYKSWRFVAVGPVKHRPVVCDDTCYFLPCRSAAEARRRTAHLNSERSREFFSAFVFNQAKRPLTADILGRLDLDALAAELDRA
jgi:hypothetical protein